MTTSIDHTATKPKRRRRTPESARREILDAAGQRLKNDGPDGLRLQAIAGDLGISHSSILHHFGSRDGLLDALSIDAFQVLERDLKSALEAPPEGEPTTDLFEKIAQILGERGHARLLAWQLMKGRRRLDADPTDPAPELDGTNGLLDRLAKTLHAMRVPMAETRGTPPPSLDESRSIVAMAGCALFGEALAGELMLKSAALGTDPEARRRFRRQLAKTMERSVFPEEAEPDGSENNDSPREPEE
jgi:AcrR family transcriptional regulator